MEKSTQSLMKFGKMIVFGAIIVSGISYAFAWTAPATSTKTSECYGSGATQLCPPLDESATNQIKKGGIGVNTMLVGSTNYTYMNGLSSKMSIGSSSTNQTLENGSLYVNGTFRLTDLKSNPISNTKAELCVNSNGIIQKCSTGGGGSSQ